GNNTILPACQYIHVVPAIIFSSSGFVGNVFRELSHVQFLLEDYEASFVRKYSKPMSLLSAYEVINPAANQSVHCFPGAIIGLKFHGHLSLNFSDSPGGHSMQDFKQFLRQAYNLKVFGGAHEAGFTNELFLPAGAVLVQIEIIGLEWAGTTYYGELTFESFRTKSYSV
ncbi:Hypothetical predicted protein, partial [Olea europaea subsp. europaea]